MWLQSKAARDKRKLSIPVSCLHLSVSISASIFGCGFIYWISGHASSVQTLPPGLAQTPSQDASSNDISGLQRWCNDNCEECSIPERSASSVIHRLAAALHKAHCWNTYFTLLVSLRQSLAPAPCLGLDGGGWDGTWYRNPLSQTPTSTSAGCSWCFGLQMSD